FMSVEMPNGRVDCADVPLAEAFAPNPANLFMGVRIFDITNINAPKQVATVQTCRGSHTHTLVTDPKDPANVYIYVSGVGHPRQGEKGMESCSAVADPTKDPNTSYFRIDVIKVPVANPKAAKIVSNPRIFADSTRNIAGLFTDEWGGGMAANCQESQRKTWGADAIFSVDKSRKLTLQSYYKLPAPQSKTENCVAHNGSLVPVPGRDILVQAWYQGGVSVMDFTDADHPIEIAYVDRGPIDPNLLVLGGDWSAYWYNGQIYASEIARGLDIFELIPTEKLTQNEIDAAKTVRMAEFNVQNQQKIVWPRNLIVAKAYVDQLERSQALPADRIAALRQAIQAAETSHLNRGDLAKLKSFAPSLEKTAVTTKSAADSTRLQGLAEILKQPAR